MFRTLLSGLILASMVGCAPQYTPKTPEQTVKDKTVEFAKYDIKTMTDSPRSHAQQLGVLMTGERPFGNNNLDEFADGYISWSRKTTQGLNAIGMVIGSISNVAGFTAILGNSGNGKKRTPSYNKNRLMIISPVKHYDACLEGKPECDLFELFEQNKATLVSMAEHAYNSDPKVASVKTIDSVKEGLFSPSHYQYIAVMPMAGKDNELTYCLKPQYQAVLDRVEEEKGPISYPPLGLGCSVIVDKLGYIYRNADSDSPYLPKGDFLIHEAGVPNFFPVEALKTDQDNVFFYQPSVAFLAEALDFDSEFAEYREKYPEDFKEHFKQKRFSNVPVFTQLSTGKKINFGLTQK
ncbi:MULTISPECIES: hypothetical protein [unclassified Vibrio]|uniref:hypothetical protein n=4 Tax=Vibrio TaxID=662 RepID=UPI0010BD04AF|nr:hypothetical protein [Vibrio sp. F13]TKF42437.1 hypothetical protein FCV49_15655 [Vibrio sp. F13]